MNRIGLRAFWSLQRKRGGPLLLSNAAWNISDSVMTSTSLGAFGGHGDFCDMWYVCIHLSFFYVFTRLHDILHILDHKFKHVLSFLPQSYPSLTFTDRAGSLRFLFCVPTLEWFGLKLVQTCSIMTTFSSDICVLFMFGFWVTRFISLVVLWLPGAINQGKHCDSS